MRKVSKKRHLIAFVLTFSIFIIGLMLGLLINNERAENLEDINKLERLSYDSLQLQHLYMSRLAEEKDCSALLSSLEENTKQLEDSRLRIENYIKDSKAGKNDFTSIKREYTLAQLRYWLFVKTYRGLCDADFVSILYFYSNSDECTECRTQGTILTYLKDIFKDQVLIFSFDADFSEEPMITTLKGVYNFTEVPVMIVEDEKLEGFVDFEELRKFVCANFETEVEECKNVM